jgi:hypothetical protein
MTKAILKFAMQTAILIAAVTVFVYILHIVGVLVDSPLI